MSKVFCCNILKVQSTCYWTLNYHDLETNLKLVDKTVENNNAHVQASPQITIFSAYFSTCISLSSFVRHYSAFCCVYSDSFVAITALDRVVAIVK